MVDKTTGVLDPNFNPAPDGAVRTFAFSPNGARIYVGGDFANISGVAQQWLVALSPDTGAYIPVVFQAFQGPVLDLDVDPDGTRGLRRAFRIPWWRQPRRRVERQHRRSAVAQRRRR